MRLPDTGSQPCSIARALAVIGDGWMLLLLRDAFRGCRRFSQFEVSSGAQPSVISARLKRMVELGLFDRVEYQQYPSRHEYHLTPAARDLYPALLMLSAWGDAHLDDGTGPPAGYVHTGCGRSTTPRVVCGGCGTPLDDETLEVVPRDADPVGSAGA